MLPIADACDRRRCLGAAGRGPGAVPGAGDAPTQICVPRLRGGRGSGAGARAAFKPWLEHQLARVSGKSGIAEELRYGLNQWEGLVRFLEDGRIELDTNIVERGIRPIVLNRKNALFAGHDEGAENWACVASLIETCKLNDVEPKAYIADVLDKLVNLWPASRIDELMPWAWPKAHAAHRLAA